MVAEKDGGAIKGKTPRMVEFDSCEFTDCERPRLHMSDFVSRVLSLCKTMFPP